MITLSSVKDIGKYRKVLGAVVAVAILAAIFVPFQNVNAFTVALDFPDTTGSVSPSLSGEDFEITIDVEAGELISIESIELILDNDLSSVKRAVFNSTGDLTSGSTSFVIDNTVEISSFTASSGYGYGYGLVSDGTTFSSPYSYSFTSNNDFIGGNNLGYSNAGVTNAVSGLIGPGTITISGSLRTASLAEGDHTLNVLIDTGAGGNNEDQLTAPTFDFEVEAEEGESEVQEKAVANGATTVEVAFDDFEVDGTPLVLDLDFSIPIVSGGNVVVTVQEPQSFVNSLTQQELDDLGIAVDGGDVFVDNGSDEFIVAGLIIDIDVSDLVLDGDTEITLSMSYDDSGLGADEEERMRIFHLPDGENEWEALSNNDNAINGGDEVDAGANLVYGTTDSFSFFAPATRESSSGGGGGGGGGSGGSGRTGGITYPESYFETNPLARFSVLGLAFTDITGSGIFQANSGQMVEITGSIQNYQRQDQDYIYIVQVVDDDGFTRSVSWITGTLEEGKNTSASRSWLTEESGIYQVKVFVWTGLDDPVPLSQVGAKSLKVN